MERIYEILRKNIKDINNIDKLFEYICQYYLGEKQSIVIHMLYIDDMSYEEIANGYNISKETVRMGRYKALKNIEKAAKEINIVKGLWYYENNI